VAVCRKRSGTSLITLGAAFSFISISAGSTLVIHGQVQESGLVDILVDGVLAAAFMQDIEERAERVETQAANGLSPI